MHIEGKSALVTGAAAGIGRAIAVALADKGASHLTLCDLDERGLAETASLVERRGARVTRRHLDVADHQALEKALEEADRPQGIDIVINNAGIVAGLPEYPHTALERMARVVSTNLTAVMTGTAVAARLMAARGGGVIINTASMTAFRPRLLDAPYRAAKAGVIMLTRCCQELAAQGVRVNAIAPGITDTPMLGKTGDGASTADWLENAMRKVRIRTPEEMAAAVINLVEDDSRAGDVVELDNEPQPGAAP